MVPILSDVSLISNGYLFQVHHLHNAIIVFRCIPGTDVAMAEEGNQKVSGEISVTTETTFNGWFIYLPCFSFLNSDSLLG
jgi:hypothetical protein